MSKKMQSLHAHTTYVDGKLSVEEMILAAIERGCDSLGFSEHSHVEYDDEFSLSIEMTPKYISELRELKAKYKNEIEIFTGLELDYDTTWKPQEDLEYTLGAVHNLKVTDEYGSDKHIAVDSTEGLQRHLVETHFGGDYYSMVEAYFAMVADVIKVTNADIVAHFDLVTKFNTDYGCFDEQHPRYLNAALGAMDEVLKDCKIFEVNTGAMYRCGKVEPYPSKHLLKELKKRGGEVIITADSHDGKSICYAFDEMRELLKSCGYTHQKRLTKNGFIDVEL